MANRVERDDNYINRLADFIRNEYGIAVKSITPAKRGFYGETWRMDSAENSYFIKIVYPTTHKVVYENSFPVIDHMNRHGIDFISKIVGTKQGKLCVSFDNAVLGVFDWIDGENRQDENTKIREYQMLGKIYTVPAEGLNIQRENFSDGSADSFFSQRALLPTDASINELMSRHRVKIEHRAERLRWFSERCQNDKSGFFITHGDAGGNYIENGDKCYIVDWDTPILAPPERDAWFCMSWDWAMDAFYNALRENGIDYILRPERLAYYCYHMFFFYLNAYLDRFLDTGETDGIEEYMSGWIEESFIYADKII
jgi:hypothetical protein